MGLSITARTCESIHPFLIYYFFFFFYGLLELLSKTSIKSDDDDGSRGITWVEAKPPYGFCCLVSQDTIWDAFLISSDDKLDFVR